MEGMTCWGILVESSLELLDLFFDLRKTLFCGFCILGGGKLWLVCLESLPLREAKRLYSEDGEKV